MAVAEGTLDCGLGPSPARAGLSFRRIGRETLYLGVPCEHPLAGRKSVNLIGLRGEKLLALGRGHRLLENVRHLAEAAGAQIVEDFEGTSLDAIRQMVSIGRGCRFFRISMRSRSSAKTTMWRDFLEFRLQDHAA